MQTTLLFSGLLWLSSSLCIGRDGLQGCLAWCYCSTSSLQSVDTDIFRNGASKTGVRSHGLPPRPELTSQKMRRTSTNHLPPDCGQRRLAPRPNQQALHGPPPGSAVGPSSAFEASTLGFDQFAFDPAAISDLDSEPQFFNQCVLDDVHLDSALWTGFNATPFPVQNWDEPAAAAAHLQSRPLNGLVSDVNDLGNISSFHEPSVSELGFTPLSPVSAAHSHAQQSNLVTPQSYAITSPGEIGSAYSGSPPAWSPSSFSDSVASAISQSSVASPRVAVCKYCGKSFRRGCELR